MSCNCENPKCPICFERNYRNLKLDSLRDDLARSLRDDLARVICASDGKAWWTETIPAVYRKHADAILASGVLDRIKADAWDEGHAATDEHGPYDCECPNPYRKEGATT